MNRKKQLIIFLIFFLLVLSPQVFAGNLGGGGVGEKPKSQSVLRVWRETFPYQKSLHGQDVSLFAITEEASQEDYIWLDLGYVFGTRPFVIGQFTYLPIDSGGDPDNLSILKQAENFVNLYKIKKNTI